MLLRNDTVRNVTVISRSEWRERKDEETTSKSKLTTEQTFWHLVNFVVMEPILGVLLSVPYRHVVLNRRKL
jgi:hypothetical protein